MATAVIDIDGTLVDTNYQHAVAWFRAFRQHGIVVPIWEIHRHVGMGGDQLVAAVTDERVERDCGDGIREAEKALYKLTIDETEPLPGARELLVHLKRRDHTVVLASSAKADEVDHYLDVLGAREIADDWTTAADVESTKPDPELVRAALEKAGADPSDAVMIGDTTWDVQAAARAGVPTLAVLTGGFGHDELVDAGADQVFDDALQLMEELDGTRLG